MINKEEYITPKSNVEAYESVDDILTVSGGSGGLEFGDTESNE